MSTMSQFFVGSGIKSIQTGYVQSSMAYGTAGTEDENYFDVTINPVTTSKTIIDVTGTTGVSAATAGFYFLNTSNATSAIRPRLTSATNLRLSARGGNPGHIQCRWYVIEFN
jgi:hypothetical protein